MGCAILSLVCCFLISDAITPLHTTLHTQTFLGQLFRSGWAVGHQSTGHQPVLTNFKCLFSSLPWSQPLCLTWHRGPASWISFLPWVSFHVCFTESFLLPTQVGISQNPFLLSPLVLHDGCVFSPAIFSKWMPPKTLCQPNYISTACCSLQPQHLKHLRLNKPPKWTPDLFF